MSSSKGTGNRVRGQVLVEFAAMLVITTVILVAMLFFLGTFAHYGARLINLVAWEPNPASYDEMSAYGREN